MRVLVVDSDEETCGLFERGLRDAGADVCPARGAKDAMPILLKWTPTVVVSDLAIAATDGFFLLREMRTTHALRHVPAIAICSMPLATDLAKALAAGFQDCVGKPLSPEYLVAIVRRWALPV